MSTLFASLVLLAATATAQDNPSAAKQVAPVLPPFTRDCKAANGAAISEWPLPNVAAALEKRKTIRILAIGASSMAGGPGQAGGYTAQIEQILEKAISGLDVVFVNRGVSGELAADAARRIRNEVALNEPDLLLWQVGTNDALTYVPVDELRQTLVETIEWLKDHHVDVVLAGLQFVHRMAQDEEYKEVRNLIRSIGREEKVVVVRRNEAMRLINQVSAHGAMFPEEFARTESGYACLAEYVARAITLGAFGQGLRDHPKSRPGAPSGEE